MNIKYPRKSAQFRHSKVRAKQKQIEKEITGIENSEIYLKLTTLRRDLRELEDKSLKFSCWSCQKEYEVRKLTLYRFISYSSGADEWRYVDDNVICPNCGKYSFINKEYKDFKKEFKEIKEIEE